MTKDFTKGNPTKLLIPFTIPILIGNVFQQFYNMVDTIIVGKFVGVNAMAAVGSTGSITFFIFSLIFGLMGGISVVISQYYGSKDEKNLKRAISTSIYSVIIVSIVMLLVGLLIAKPILILLKTPEAIIDDAYTFLNILCFGFLPIGLYNGAASIIRALGDSKTPLIFLAISSVLNIVLDLVFIINFNMGIAGAGYATVISQLISAILCIIYAYKKIPILKLKLNEMIFHYGMLRKIIRLSIPSALQTSSISIGSMALQGLINSFGATIVASYSAAIKLEQLMLQPGVALGNALATYAAQNVGAGKPERVYEGIRTGTKIISIFSIIATIAVFFLNDKFLLLFVSSSEVDVLRYGQEYIRINSIFYIFVGYIFVYRETLRGTGDVMIPMIMGIFELVSRFVIALILSKLLGYIGLWWGTPAAWVSASLLGIYRFKSGKWKEKAVVKVSSPKNQPPNMET